MKARYAIALALMLIGPTVSLVQEAIAQDEIPLTMGQFSISVQGTVAACFNPVTSAQEPCSAAGALVVRVSILRIGIETIDGRGNFCVTATDVESALDARPPIVTPNLHVAGKVLNYGAASGTGDNSFTTYAGGTCNGATFDSTGAIESASGNDHFVVTDNGNRFDGMATRITTPAGSVGGFSYSFTGLRQKTPGFSLRASKTPIAPDTAQARQQRR